MSDIAAPNLSGQSSAFPVSNHRVGRSAFSRLELGLRDASTQQDELSEARQQVLIDRQRVASSARQIRELRNGIAGKEARIMDIFRKYYTDLGERMPDDLILAYSDVENSRNDLIIAEDVHNDKEQDLELSEMTLTDQEADLYQLKLPQLLQVENTDTFEASVNLGSLPLSCSPSEVTQRAAALDREALVHGSYNPKRRVSYSLADYNPLRRNGSPEAEYVSSRAQYFNEEVDHMFRRELQAQNTQVVSSTLRNSALINGREPCEIVRASPFIHHVAEAPSHRPKTVFIEKTWSAKDDPDLELPIDDWILNYLKMNATEKLQMVAILRAAIGEPWNDDLDFDHWNELVVKFWLQGVKKVEHVSEPEPPQPVLISQESHHGIGTHTLTADQIYRDNSGTLSQQYRRPPPSQSPRPYNIPNLAVDILVPRVQSDIRPVGNYGLLDLEEDDEFKLRSDQGHPPQPEPCFPILQVTTPNDNPVIASGATEDSNRLAPCNNFRSRNDSAHDSEVEKEQCLRGSVHDSMHDHNSSRANDKSVLGMLESRSEVEVLNVHFDELKTAGVDYSGWVWSPSLRLYYSNGFGDDDEIIESLWLDCRDSGDDSNPCHFPQEEIASDIE
ncbi:hypothetical protein IQ06DRAFT_134754 [Phaeosphaeriaceae sp. SRC1lsM3a]|nr:hypothetical protein IQ06DRAFT_134754 [Stagonospora sp. SRC1lsM3a]